MKKNTIGRFILIGKLLVGLNHLNAAENYITAHFNQSPEVVTRFIDNLSEEDRLNWKALFFVENAQYEEANACFYKLAQKGYASGYSGLADSYLAGHGFQKNSTLALTLYEKAAGQGDGPSMVHAAVLRAEKDNRQKSQFWFRKALRKNELAFMKQEIQVIANKWLN